jgi:arylmalonate decarboxylase
MKEVAPRAPDRSAGDAETLPRPAEAPPAYDPYGWMAKVGLIVPSTNRVISHEWSMMAPAGVSIHTARVLLYGTPSQRSNDLMAERTASAAEQLATAEVDIIAYGTTSGSFHTSEEDIAARISGIAGCPATTTSEAVIRALAALGARRIALASPYLGFVNARAVAYLEAAGFEVVSEMGLGMGETQAERRAINRIPPRAIFRMARAADRAQADTIFVSCTTMPTVTMIAAIERALGKPVVTSTQATFWDVLARLGISLEIRGFGRLLEAGRGRRRDPPAMR